MFQQMVQLFFILFVYSLRWHHNNQADYCIEKRLKLGAIHLLHRCRRRRLQRCCGAPFSRIAGRRLRTSRTDNCRHRFEMLQQLIFGAGLNDVLDQAANDEQRIERMPHMAGALLVRQLQQTGDLVQEHGHQRAQIAGHQIVADETLAEGFDARIEAQLFVAGILFSWVRNKCMLQLAHAVRFG